MDEHFRNTYEDRQRAASYAKLEFPGTYHLAFRDLPDILTTHLAGKRALDFGCGTGRSTRFLRDLGFEVTGVDISPEMLRLAGNNDPAGDYRLVEAGVPMDFDPGSFDLVLAAYPFDNIPSADAKTGILQDLGRLLRPGGRIFNLVSSPEIYVNEWVSFSTRDYPENAGAVSGDVVRIVMLDVDDARPVEDVLWTHESYLEVYEAAGLETEAVYRPLGRPEEDFPWDTELVTAPWVIYVLKPVSPAV
ncbi:MAG: methyltransferase domain-containing protein [Xanthomonadales bacterium]|nr:class I SAM-dependent methyltransferase [Xanthomonadales bacterium]NIX11932.1 methyltransferase domain-containing protein [Xanthomonadales bacterium]